MAAMPPLNIEIDCRSQAVRENRVGIFWITPRDLVALITGWGAGDGFMRPVAPDLPVDATVEAVHFDWQRGAFALVVSHPSFAVVHPGDPIEWLGEIRVQLRPPNELSLDNFEGFQEWMAHQAALHPVVASPEILRDSTVDLASQTLPNLLDEIMKNDADCDLPAIVTPGDPSPPPPA